jgi:hypothetical protein
MPYRILADLVVLLHASFVVFVAIGGLLAVRWKHWAWVHVPVVLWGAMLELGGWICPLTPLENRLREQAGLSTYGTGFIDRYIFPVLYPSGMTRSAQVALGISALVLNGCIYAWALRRHRRRVSAYTIGG